MHTILVLAMAENGVIGQNGAIPWRIPDDMKRFKALTMGKTVVMGRKTWDSLPRRPLPGRHNVVATRDPGWRAAGAMAVTLPDIDLSYLAPDEEVMVIGGAEIYRYFLPRAARIELTEIHRAFAGDTVFAFDRASWREVAREGRTAPDGLRYSFVTLIR